MGDAEAHVVAERAEVGHVVGDPLQLDHERPQEPGVLGDLDRQGILDREAVGESVGGGGVARDALGEDDALGDLATFEEPLDAPVDEPQAGFHLEDRLADDEEAEVAGLDQPGMDRPDGDLVDAGALDGGEGEGLGVDEHRRHRPRITAHRVPVPRPVLVAHQGAEEGMADRLDAEQVGQLALEASGGEGEGGEGRERRAGGVEADLQLDPAVGRPGAKDVHHPQGPSVVVTGDQGQAEPRPEQRPGPCRKVGGGEELARAHRRRSGVLGARHRTTTLAAA